MQTSLAVDPSVIPAADNGLFTRLLVPVDFSPGSRLALATAFTLQRSLASEVHLFNLTDVGANDEFLAGIGGGSLTQADLVERAKERLRRFVDNLFPGRAGDVAVHARMGVDVVSGIETMAKAIGASLVLLGGQRNSSIFRTDIEKIARDIDAAVMLLWVPETTAAS
jgi:nucleotide-binding universal stress UspA family protein